MKRIPPSLASLVAIACLLTACRSTGSLRNETPHEREARIHREAVTVDTHVDWPSRQLAHPEFDAGIRHEPGIPESGQWDLPRMKEGGLDAVFLSIFTGQGELSTEGRDAAREEALAQIRLVRGLAEDYPTLAGLATGSEAILRLEREGRRALLLGMENGYPIGTDLARVEEFHREGIRYVTLCHSRTNDLCDSSTDDHRPWDGLSPFGEEVVREMNRLGIMIDISHVSDETVREVLASSRAPVIASHSGARAVCDHPRNLPDDLLVALRDHGGVVQVCLVGSFVKSLPPDPEREAAIGEIRDDLDALRRGEIHGEAAEAVRERYRAINRDHPRPLPTLADAVDHIDHIVAVAGVDHVGLGSDFDGGGGVKGLMDVYELPHLTAELLARGYSEEDVRKILGGNLLRVFRAVEQAAATPPLPE